MGDQIVPAHIIFSQDWVTKDSPPEPLRDEERAFLENNPHQAQLMDLFNLAGVGYGRIDYGLLDGQIQVWEINTNPTLVQTMEKYFHGKLPMKQRLVDQLSAAFLQLHERVASSGAATVRVPLRLFDRGRLRPRQFLRRLLRGRRL